MNTEYFTQASLAVQIHILVAVTAFCLGLFMFARRKGTQSHKIMGRIFAFFMMTTAVSAIFIRQMNQGHFSWIHLFVPLTFLGLFQAFWYIRKGNVKRHKGAVKGFFLALCSFRACLLSPRGVRCGCYSLPKTWRMSLR